MNIHFIYITSVLILLEIIKIQSGYLLSYTEASEIDLPIKPDRKWVHMDKVEYDKLSWLKDLPQPTTDHSEVGYLVYSQT